MNKKKKAEKTLKQSKFKEISMGSDSIDQLFDSSHKIGFETEEERIYREKKEDYNVIVIDLIKKYVFGKNYMSLNFTERQQEIFKLMFQDGLTLTEVSRKLKVSVVGIHKIKEILIEKIKAKISYDFVDDIGPEKP